jgi:hypothetical protein
MTTGLQRACNVGGVMRRNDPTTTAPAIADRLRAIDEAAAEVVAAVEAARQSGQHFDGTAMLGKATRLASLISDMDWGRKIRFGLDHAEEWCAPGLGGCGLSRWKHEHGRLCVGEE